MRPTRSSCTDIEAPPISEVNSSTQVFTYLDETRRSVSYSHKRSSDLKPWLLYGPPDSPAFLAESELKNLQVMSLKDYKKIIPVQLSFANGTRTAEIYYLIIEYFSSLSDVHNTYCRTTPEGFLGSFSCSGSTLTDLKGALDAQFHKLMWVCFANMSAYSGKQHDKVFVDTQVLPDLINSEFFNESLFAARTFYEYGTKVSEGDLLPFVKFCVAHNYLRSDICFQIYSLLITRVQSNSIDAFNHVFMKFYNSTDDFIKAAMYFEAALQLRHMLQEKPATAKRDNNKSLSRNGSNKNTPNKGNSNKGSFRKSNNSNNRGKLGGKPHQRSSNSPNTKPWLSYGPPDSPAFLAESKLKNLHCVLGPLTKAHLYNYISTSHSQPRNIVNRVPDVTGI